MGENGRALTKTSMEVREVIDGEMCTIQDRKSITCYKKSRASPDFGVATGKREGR